MERVSPNIAQYRKQLTGNDIGLISAELKQSRELAWTFVQQLLVEPESDRAKVIDDHDTIFAWLVRRRVKPASADIRVGRRDCCCGKPRHRTQHSRDRRDRVGAGA